MIPGMIEEGKEDLAEYVSHNVTFIIPGGVVAQFVMKDNMEDALFNMTICLDTMMMDRPSYDSNGHSNHKDYQF
jgi:hypothetical protein